jgi:hypothetical protein
MFNKPDGAGKGDVPRPTDWDKFSKNFDEIFGKKTNDTATTTSGEEKTGEGISGKREE